MIEHSVENRQEKIQYVIIKNFKLVFFFSLGPSVFFTSFFLSCYLSFFFFFFFSFFLSLLLFFRFPLFYLCLSFWFSVLGFFFSCRSSFPFFSLAFFFFFFFFFCRGVGGGWWGVRLSVFLRGRGQGLWLNVWAGNVCLLAQVLHCISYCFMMFCFIACTMLVPWSQWK